MCLAIPARVLDVSDHDGMLVGRVDFGGVCRRVCLSHVPDVAAGEYVLVHVGFAIARIDEAEARRVFDLLAELGALADLEESG